MRWDCQTPQAPSHVEWAGALSRGLSLILQLHSSVGVKEGGFSAGWYLPQALRTSSASVYCQLNKGAVSQVVLVQPLLPSSSAFCGEKGYKMMVLLHGKGSPGLAELPVSKGRRCRCHPELHQPHQGAGWCSRGCRGSHFMCWSCLALRKHSPWV